jgi:hypothetical protein
MNPAAPLMACALAISIVVLFCVIVADWWASIPVDPPWAEDDRPPDAP